MVETITIIKPVDFELEEFAIRWCRNLCDTELVKCCGTFQHGSFTYRDWGNRKFCAIIRDGHITEHILCPNQK